MSASPTVVARPGLAGVSAGLLVTVVVLATGLGLLLRQSARFTGRGAAVVLPSQSLDPLEMAG